MIEALSRDASFREMLQDFMSSRLQLSSTRGISAKALPIASIVLSPQLLLMHIQLEELVHLASLVRKCRLPACTEIKISVSAKIWFLVIQCLC